MWRLGLPSAIKTIQAGKISKKVVNRLKGPKDSQITTKMTRTGKCSKPRSQGSSRSKKIMRRKGNRKGRKYGSSLSRMSSI